MRVLRVLPLIGFFLLPASMIAQQAVTPATHDPQATAVLDAAIAALGGATAISQSQSWAFQAQLDGLEKGSRSDTIGLNVGPGTPVAMPNGTTITKPPAAFPSPILPTLVAALLLKQSKDPNYVVRHVARTTLGSQTVTVVSFWLARSVFGPAQNWYFDNATGLPIQIEFRLPAQIGHIKSLRGVSVLSDYRSVSGVLYPFHIVTATPGQPSPETITLQSLSPSSSTASTAAGGVQ